MKRALFNRGFTLIELLVVIAIIGILASVILVSLNTARSRARDAQRKSDLTHIAQALELYYNNHNTYTVAGTGISGTGSGWFSYTGGVYTKSVAQGLVDDNDIAGFIVDPSGVTTSTNGRSGYMIQVSGNQYTLWANLENPSTADKNTLNNCALSTWDNYPPGSGSAAMNYCVSN